MKTVEVAYNDNFPGNVFEEALPHLTWHPLAKQYDPWTASIVLMAQQMGFELLEADLVVQEPNCEAPPTREFKLVNGKLAKYLIIVPLLEIFFWVNEKHDDCIHPDVILAEVMGGNATVVVNDNGSSVIQIKGGPTFIDPRTKEDRKPTRKYE